jgi:hypothetical protein
MFTIEHSFAATSIILIDDTVTHLLDDVTINAFENCITIEQWDPSTNKMHKVTLSMSQAQDLSAALDLPEGVYQRADTQPLERK